MAKSKKRPLAVIRINGLRRLGNFLEKMHTILAAIAANTTLFATPSPTVASVNGHLDDVVDAQTQVGLRVPGSVGVRNQKYSILLDDAYALGRYVQGIADNAADEQAAITVITSSGFDLKVNGVFEKPALAVKPTVTPNIVRLVAKSAGRRASYNWQQSINNGASWIDLATTLRADLTVSGLTSGTRYVFRFRSITKAGTSAWSASVGIVIQ